MKLRGATLVACGGLLACVAAACGGGDDTTVIPSNDSGVDASMADTGGNNNDSGGGNDVTTIPPDTGADAPADRASEATTDAPLGDARGDATTDASTDAANDGSHPPDAAAEAEASTQVTPLAACPELDLDYALASLGLLDGIPDEDYLSRTSVWGADITNNFAGQLTTDCTLNGLADLGLKTNGAYDGALVAGYLSQVPPFVVQLMGCGLADAGALTFQPLIPLQAQGHVFTVADLNLLANAFVNAVIAQASVNWVTNTPTGNPEPLTGAQISALQSAMTALAATYPGVNPNMTRVTINNCSDGGAEGGTEAGAEAGSDAGSDAAGD